MNLGQTSITTQRLKAQNGQVFYVDKYNFVFNPWPHNHNFDTYGGKQVLQFDNEPLFAELVLLRLLQGQGYKGVWVDTYRNKFWQGLPHFSLPVSPDKKILETYHQIINLNGGRKSGCFDIIAYIKDFFVFVELKRQKVDSIRQAQIEWLKAAKSIELHNPKFIIAEWTL